MADEQVQPNRIWFPLSVGIFNNIQQEYLRELERRINLFIQQGGIGSEPNFNSINLSSDQTILINSAQLAEIIFETVSVLPDPAVLGKVVHLLTNNRLYFGKYPP